MLAMFVALIDQTIVATVLPAMAQHFGQVQNISWVVLAYLLTATVAAPCYGRLGDFLGRRQLMIIALLITGVGTLCCALSQSLSQLVAARVLQGLGGGGLMTLSHALIGEAVAPRDRARYQGFLSAVGVSASAFGPVAGGWLSDSFGWRSVFFVSLPLVVLATAMVTRLKIVTRSAEPFRFDFPGLLLLILTVCPFLFALHSLQDFSNETMAVAASLIAFSVAAGILLVLQERRSTTPLLPLALLGKPAIWRCDMLAACHGATLVSLLTYVPLYLRIVHSASATEIGFLLLPLTMGIGIGSLSTGLAISRSGRTAIFPSLGLIAASVAIAHFALFAAEMRSTPLMLNFLLIALFLGTVMGTVQLTVQLAAGPMMLGSAAGSVQLSRSIGAAIGTAISGLMLFTVLNVFGADTVDAFMRIATENPLPSKVVEPTAQALMQNIGFAFSLTFLLIALISAVASVFAWTMPIRRVS